MSKKTVRVVLDVLLTIMIVFEMFIQFTGDFLHEVIGAALFITILVHLGLSAKWMKNTANAAKTGKMTARRAALAIMGCLLAVTTLVLAVSSVAISNVLIDAGFVWPIGSYATWVVIHTISSYALCALVALHLAMHWAFLANAFKVPYNPARRQAIGTGVYAVAALGAVALGVSAAREVMPQNVLQQTTGQTDDGATAPDASTESPSSSSSSAQSEGTDRRKDSKKRSDRNSVERGSTPSTPNENSGSDANSSSNDGTNPSTAPEANSSNGSNDTGNSGTTTDVSGICTLCRKQCPLSAPQCDKPYRAGLI